MVEPASTWEKVVDSSQIVCGDVFVTARPNFRMGVSRAALRELGFPERVDVLRKPGSRVVGIRPSEGPDSFPFRKDGGNAYLVVPNLLDELKIVGPMVKRYRATMEDDDVLVVDFG